CVLNHYKASFFLFIYLEFESSRVNAKGPVEKQPKEFERQAALTFSEKFKPSSYEEATLLYEITGILNKRLEEYFWRSKRPLVKEKLEWKGASQTYEDCGRNSISKYSVSKDSGKHSPSRDSSKRLQSRDSSKRLQSRDSSKRLPSRDSSKRLPSRDSSKSSSSSDSGKSSSSSDSGEHSSYRDSGKHSCRDSGKGSSYRDSGKGSSYRDSGKLSSYRDSGKRSSYRDSGKGSSYRDSGKGSSYRDSGKGSPYRDSGKGSSYRVSGKSSSYRVSGKNSSYKDSVKNSSYRDPGKDSSYRDSGKDYTCTGLQMKKHNYDETDGTPILSLPLPPYGTNTQQLFESEPVETISHFPFITVPYNNSSSASNSFYGVPHPGQNAQYYSSLYTYNPYVNTPFLHVPQNPAMPSNTVTSPVEQLPAMFTDLAAHGQETPVTFAHTIPPEDVPFIGGSSETQTSPHEETDTDEQEPAPSASSNEQCSETVSASHSSGKTSKALTPDVINLLKGKDVDTVIKILKTIAPFYPALQDVNIDMFAQVLFYTGALD
uniref:Uncharacterized protein n=1 Tax=Leptobrachium leishanense TaxID=445787 RepID=A0A8C5M356_9ANUR